MARILVIDDDGDVRETLTRLVEMDGHEATAPRSSDTTVATIMAGLYDLVITDIIMPDIDGIEVLKLVREYKPACPILAISGGSPKLDSNVTLHMAGRLGADATLKKPFSRSELQAAIRGLLPAER